MAAVAAAMAGVMLAGLIANAGAASPPAQTVVLGSAQGAPTASECQSGVRCTYIAYNGNQFMIVPFDGTITSFSVNSATAGGQVELRVLSSTHPPQYVNDQWTGAGTGPAETLQAGMNTFAVNMPVTRGETIALDNDSGAPVFDRTSPAAQYATVGYYAPALADGATAYVNRARSGESLLLSATVMAAPVTPTTTTTATTPAAPIISRVFEVTRSAGTTFTFTLDQAATVTVGFTHQASGRSVRGSCVAQNRNHRRAAPCTRVVRDGALLRAGHPGLNRVSFSGRIPGRARALAPGTYAATIVARNAAGEASDPVGLTFTIRGG